MIITLITALIWLSGAILWGINLYNDFAVLKLVCLILSALCFALYLDMYLTFKLKRK